MKKVLILLLLSSWCMAENNLLSKEDMQKIMVDNSSAVLEHIDASLKDYVKGGAFPAIASYIHLDHEANSVTTLQEKNVSNYLNAYFPAQEEYTYFYTLSQQDSQKVRHIEALLLSNKTVMAFLQITKDWKSGNIIHSDEQSEVLGSQGVLLVGFDHAARYFIAQSCHEQGVFWISYEYVQKHIQSSFYANEMLQESIDSRNVNFDISRWKVGSGNFFTPYARVDGTISGHPAFIKWLRVVIEFKGKKRVVLKQRIVAPGDSFRFKEKYNRFGSRYCILECTNNDFEVTRFIKRPIEK